MIRKTIVAANWKLNGDLALVNQMAQALNDIHLQENVKVIVCPSAPYLSNTYFSGRGTGG